MATGTRLMWTPEILVIIIFTFILAGFVKGVSGLGLPTVALALLTAMLGLTEAMVLMLVPSLVTNIWQALAGKALKDILRRQWLLLVTACLATLVFVHFSAFVDATYLLAFLGLILCLYSVISLFTPQITIAPTSTGWLSPVIGVVTGAITGLTGTFVVPAVPYFQALDLPRPVLVQTMGVWFTIATLSLGVGLNINGLMSAELTQLSVVAVVPAMGGMWMGQKVREKLPEQKFRRVFFITLLILGVYIAARAILR